MMAATFADIQKKVRLLTRSPSISQISDADVKSYINNFILYDMPEELRLFTFRRVLSFYTSPYIDTYETNTINNTDPLYNFKNAYITTHDPVYIAGKRAYFTQDRTIFNSLFKTCQQEEDIASGDGVTTGFTGSLDGPIIQNSVVISSYDLNGEALILIDRPQIEPVTGHRMLIGDMYVPNDTTVSYGTINYKTGDLTFNFPLAPDDGASVYAHYIAHTPGRPTTVLYFDNKFVLRPIPDKTYEVKIETNVRPDELVNDGDYPELEQHWQYIAYGAAQKVFEDRMDLESVALIRPELERQKELCLRRTLVQKMNERTSTIYTQQLISGGNPWNWFNCS